MMYSRPTVPLVGKGTEFTPRSSLCQATDGLVDMRQERDPKG